MNILVPSVPARLKITQTMVEDIICDPVFGAKYIFGMNLDAFQRVRLKVSWNTPRVMDSSGLSSAKTLGMWIVANLRALTLPNLCAGVYYPSFETGKRTFALYFQQVAMRSPLYRAQLGRQRVLGLDSQHSNEIAKALMKGPSCWVWELRNGSMIMMPAPGFSQDAKTSASYRFNDLYVDEWTKVEASGSEGIDDQLIGRTTRESWNKEHPIYRNHHIFLATAEDTMHKAYDRYAGFLKEVKSGNPDYALISFNFKDYSDLPARDGATFKEKHREDLAMKDLKMNKTRAGFLQEGLGCWSKNGRGLYVAEMFDRANAVGVQQGADYYCSRQEDVEGERAYYFMGVDPAKSETKKADDGAIVILRAVPMISEHSTDPRTYKLHPCFAYKVRNADAEQWSGIIHLLHQRFGLTGIMMDPGGGGVWIQPKLKDVEQKIRGVVTRVKPIATAEDEEGMMVNADFILCMFRPRDIRIQQAWAAQTQARWGPENLTDSMHHELCSLFNDGVMAFPPNYRDVPKEKRALWNDEKRYAAMWIADHKKGLAHQLSQINIAVDDLGKTLYTRGQNPARSFSSRERKDFAYSLGMAAMRFLIWVRTGTDDLGINDDDAALCGSSRR